MDAPSIFFTSQSGARVGRPSRPTQACTVCPRRSTSGEPCRLRTEAADRYTSAADLLADLERIGPDFPASADAWNRMVKYVAENATDGVAWRKSA